ncbi:MAG TPA: TonB family protein [Longimicrobium sp.]|jgi:TonB family protein|nr:TonB family protein [Longimicrobium sp.]
MRSPATIGLPALSAGLALVAACAAPANPRPRATLADPSDTTVVWDYRDVTRRPELLNGAEAAGAIERSYPPVLRDRGITGGVTLELVASREGTVESVGVLDAADPQFGAAARAVAVRMRFRPALVRGIPVRCRFTLPVRFDLTP